MRFGYADPPYYGNGKKRYGELHPEAGKWDLKKAHIELVESLNADFPEGWALSCNPQDLSWLLLAIPEARVCAWVKNYHQIRPTTIQHAWEPLLVCGGRKENKRKPMVRDWLMTTATKQKGIPGAKPHKFNLWVLDLLNFQPGDELIDLFPGSGGMAKAIRERMKERQQTIKEAGREG